MKEKKNRKLSASFRAGAVALVFLIIGYEAALFIAVVGKRNKSSGEVVTVVDTVYVAKESGEVIKRTNSPRPPASVGASAKPAPFKSRERNYESFPFDPNTVSVRDLQRLGLSEKQALSIDSYRKAGGRFHRPSDFARSYVVSDTLFERLEPFIIIPKLDINKADSASFDSLPGIGPYFASKMVEYRKRLRGYSYPEQLMEIWKFDAEKYSALSDLIEVGVTEPYPLWTLPEDSLKLHPYIGNYAAHGVVIFRENSPEENWTVGNLKEAGILKEEDALRLERCVLR